MALLIRGAKEGKPDGVRTRTVQEEALHTVLLPRDPVAGVPESPHIKKNGRP